ncbi:MAG: trypsin-like peptidase domain-containing protein [Verrucomicrobia bacterium]|nr:trypsin-like peptidase domain-containing protein [Verrucomicrobiota bacterium]
MKPPSFCLALFVVGWCGFGATADPADPPRSAPRDSSPAKTPFCQQPRPGEPVNDHALYHYLELEGGKLLDQSTCGAELHKQTTRRTCRLTLPAPATQKLASSEIAACAENSVVVLGRFYQCDHCTRTHLAVASGFLLTESGALATCLHVVKTNRTLGLVAMTRDGNLWPIREVLAADPLSDAVILQLQGSGFKPLPLSTNAPAGSPVMVLSHPQGHYYMVTAGIVSRYYVKPVKEGFTPMMSITARFARGSSGAPVLNEYGCAVGTVNNTQSIYFDADEGRNDNFQMTVNNCTPAKVYLQMVRPR